MLKLIPLLIRIWPVIKPILPVLLQILRENQHLLKQNNSRPDTTPAEDARDFFHDMDRKKKWEPFKKEWED